ncbi:class I SAM-dependent methyltransferase [Hoeflea prorocentri]|uniref:Class I SAM-dependent methyltransferase n=1 Tax=Hoeflea prorocentri TaxID=1922333 RepID=A0A9X3UKC5_9HYPH|nr:methyltransferase domain-containing protein [Hoeflea prorocentri]MCY6382010.1 class I SAM-dependent methyltransferase [Hoeflea prorocentri]MDA5399810.1 class I SAM-dependent methyltransferase [Hoeflea prorocentri]
MTTDAAKAGQVSGSAAEIYDEFFVPALFGAWAEPLCTSAGLKSGQSVLDVACGTGATTRVAETFVQPGGAATGLDRNDDMLSVARSKHTSIDWRSGMAEALPFDDATFDVVLCQFGLMFFEDRQVALKEMRRVVRPGGTIAASVWDKAEHSPGYDAMIRLIDDLFGKDPADALRAPFVLGEIEALEKALSDGGMSGASIVTQHGTARFPSIEEWARLDVRGWTLSEFFDDASFEKLLTHAREKLAKFAGPDGTVTFAAPVHIAVWSSE